VASPKLAAAHASNLEGLPWVSWERGQSDILETQWLSRTFPDAVVALRASELNTLLHAAKAGVGALLAPESIAAAEGGLVALPLEGPALPRGSLFLVTHRALRNVPRVAAVWEWLEAVLTGPAPAL
jgi:DNA-binding transcriptional LysR family regulator